MSKKILITPEYMFKYTILDDNIDDKLIQKYIWIAQDINIQQLLGGNLYSKIISDCPTFTGVYYTLVTEYIQPALAQWTLYHLMPWINNRLTNKAVSQKSSDNSQPSTNDDVIWLREQVMNVAEYYTERARDFIKNNETSLPEYNTSGNVYEIKPTKSSYFSGIHTSKRKYLGGLDINDGDPCDFCD